MKKYKVMARYSTFLETELEAEDIQQALDIAREMDGGEFKETVLGEWTIDDIKEIA